MKPLAALVKAYRGGEWLEASLESVRRQCAGAVVVLSDGPWREVAGTSHPPENCRAPLERFRRRHPEFPVVVQTLRRNASTTESQYAVGMDLIGTHFGRDCGVLLLDTDEVWDDAELAKLRAAMSEDTGALVFRSRIWTYLRSPLWRVAPQEDARVVVGLARPGLPTGKSRLADIHKHYKPAQIRDVGCVFHHFGYVRDDPDEITAKLERSTSQDRVPTRPDWKRVVWDVLPRGANLHPQTGFERCWGRVEPVTADMLPPAATDADAFWAGLAWHGSDQVETLLDDDPRWRTRAESMPPDESPPTVVSESMLPAVRRLGLPEFLRPHLRMSLRETAQLMGLARGVPAGGTALEIGSGKGGSMAAMMAAVRPSAYLVAVDPYLPYDEHNVNLDRNVREGSADEFAGVVARMRADGFGPGVRAMPVASADAVGSFPDDTLDLILVDGNHSFEHCKQDLDLWWPKLRTGGVLLVHDYATRFPGVVRAVREFEAERGVRLALPLRSTLAWLRKI